MTPHWQQRRRDYYRKYPKVCFCCGLDAKDLHHIRYDNLGREPDCDLIPVCRFCHGEIHRLCKEQFIPLEKCHEYLKKNWQSFNEAMDEKPKKAVSPVVKKEVTGLAGREAEKIILTSTPR